MKLSDKSEKLLIAKGKELGVKVTKKRDGKLYFDKIPYELESYAIGLMKVDRKVSKK